MSHLPASLDGSPSLLGKGGVKCKIKSREWEKGYTEHFVALGECPDIWVVQGWWWHEKAHNCVGTKYWVGLVYLVRAKRCPNVR